jgi:glycosyltransferase involved in cell wall biosynthesis
MDSFNQRSNGHLPRVVIVERRLLHYRVDFFEKLRSLLQEDGIKLELLVGEAAPEEIEKKDGAVISWAKSIPTTYLYGDRLCWQPFAAHAKTADLVIINHENKLLYNLWLLFMARPKRIAFWGHGCNMQSARPNGIKETFKRWTVNKADWWFAYTRISSDILRRAGFPEQKTTIVNNAVDTRKMASLCAGLDAAERLRVRNKLGLTNGPLGIYVGSLYAEKRLDFLLQAAQMIRNRIPDFQLLVIGAGPEQEKILHAARENDWVKYAGQLQGADKAAALVLAQVMLNPGLVGLGILDSFVSGAPMITTDCGLHSPEVCYLESGVNGIMTADNLNAYADAAVEVLSSPHLHDRLRAGALESGDRYTVERMAELFRNGIVSCLNSEPGKAPAMKMAENQLPRH